MKGLRQKIRGNRYLSWLLIVSNWLFQGIIHADVTEKFYKILFTLIFWLPISFFIIMVLEGKILSAVVAGGLIAHTLNWVVNGNFFNLFIHRIRLAKSSKTNLFIYLDGLAGRLTNQGWVLYAATFGSICSGNLKDSSDIDVSIVRKPGIRNAFRSLFFALREKKIADWEKIPLELYISDSPANSRNRFRCEDNPVVLYDPDDTVKYYYARKNTLDDAKKLNGLE